MVRSSRGLENVVSDERNGTFKVNTQCFKMSKFQAEFISPSISNLVRSNQIIKDIEIPKRLANGQSVTIPNSSFIDLCWSQKQRTNWTFGIEVITFTWKHRCATWIKCDRVNHWIYLWTFHVTWSFIVFSWKSSNMAHRLSIVEQERRVDFETFGINWLRKIVCTRIWLMRLNVNIWINHWLVTFVNYWAG
jgi:hypothetical protein